MYLAETQRRKEDGQLIAVDSHHSMLRTTKTFYKWLVATQQIKVSPFAEVRYVGRPKRGKTQLRIDEARKLVAVALEHASNRKVAPAAILMQIFLGLRPTESVVRAVRDLDDEGRMLWVPFGKTSNAKRRLQVPETLRQVLLLHAEGKSADDPLLGPLHEPEHNRDLIYYNLRKLCQEAWRTLRLSAQPTWIKRHTCPGSWSYPAQCRCRAWSLLFCHHSPALR